MGQVNGLSGGRIDNVMIGAGNKILQTVVPLGGTLTMTSLWPMLSFLDPSGSDREVRLPAEYKGGLFIVVNSADATGEELTVKEDAGVTTIGVIGFGDSGIFVCDGTTWTMLRTGFAVTGVGAAGLKIAYGTATLDGSNPTPVTTGLTAVVAAVVSLKAAATPGDDPTSFSVGYTGGTLNIYAYKTNGTDPTLVASTDNAATVDWIAIGT